MAKGRSNAKQTDPAQGDQAAGAGEFSGEPAVVAVPDAQHEGTEQPAAQAAEVLLSPAPQASVVIDAAVLAAYRAQRAVARSLFVGADEADVDWVPPMLTYEDCEVMAAAARASAARGNGVNPTLLATAARLSGRPLRLTQVQWTVLAGVMGTTLLQVDAWLAAGVLAAEHVPPQWRVSPDELSDLCRLVDEPLARASYAAGDR